MAPPEKRAVAPGAQQVRVDNVKDRSWILPEGPPGLIGQIFFATDDATVDDETQAKLDDMAQKYAHDMILNPTTKYSFYFFGYADHRAGEAYNLDLSQRRADAVEVIVRRTLITNVNLTMHSQGLGIDESDPRTTTDAKRLAMHRRVDIIGPKLRGVPPPDPDPPSTPKVAPLLSTRWKARMKKSGSGSVAWFQGDRFYMDFVDLTNSLILEMRYMGFGFGLSPAPFGISYSGSPTDWLEFTTSQPVAITDFEGFAFHTSGQAQAPPTGSGGTFDLVILTLAKSRRKPDWVSLTFHGFTLVDKNVGLGAAQTGGAIQPTEEYGPPRLWSPTDP